MKEKKCLLQAKKISKQFSSHEGVFELFSQVDLDIYEADTIACTGRSGEGKTTLLHILGGLEVPTEGSIFLPDMEGKRIIHDEVRTHFCGFIFQGFHLLEDQSVLKNILLPAHIARVSFHQQKEFLERAQVLLHKVGLESKTHTKAKWLSGGEKQRVAIARALLMNPKILFADEPTGNLDNQTASTIIDLLFGTVLEEKRSLFIVSHQTEIEALCSRKTVLKNKRLIHL